jgi:hypothetical protein
MPWNKKVESALTEAEKKNLIGDKTRSESSKENFR